MRSDLESIVEMICTSAEGFVLTHPAVVVKEVPADEKKNDEIEFPKWATPLLELISFKSSENDDYEIDDHMVSVIAQEMFNEMIESFRSPTASLLAIVTNLDWLTDEGDEAAFSFKNCCTIIQTSKATTREWAPDADVDQVREHLVWLGKRAFKRAIGQLHPQIKTVFDQDPDGFIATLVRESERDLDYISACQRKMVSDLSAGQQSMF